MTKGIGKFDEVFKLIAAVLFRSGQSSAVMACGFATLMIVHGCNMSGKFEVAWTCQELTVRVNSPIGLVKMAKHVRGIYAGQAGDANLDMGNLSARLRGETCWGKPGWDKLTNANLTGEPEPVKFWTAQMRWEQTIGRYGLNGSVCAGCVLASAAR